MQSTSSTAASLIAPGLALPGWADRLLEQPGEGNFFASRLWFDTVLANALPDDATPVLATDAARTVLLVLVRRSGRLASLTGPYSLAWRPLHDPAADVATRHIAARAIARALTGEGPVTLELIDPALPALPAFLAGLRAGRAFAAPFDHVGNWYEPLGDAPSWEGYLAARPPTLRTTITRKLARARRSARFQLLRAPGPALEAGIAAYEDVRARSWKPDEPFPAFDAALMRAAAAAGLLRLGVLWEADAGRAIAAQYWILDRTEAGLRRATVLKLAHDEAARAASPGTVLTAMMIPLLIEEDGVQVLDFGRGDDPYKQLWAATRRQRIGLVIADPLSPRGLVALARQWAGPLVRRLSGR
ncbi:GNAT family N-acetyltransferase [Elioraea sp.]|uniref:GNAT family N-acetyltransferase n=1 Tax=Elioraea sp. TaxID=2185103 RepID=UPI0025C110CA|nr:GNAT family N-acetyltransferase [Elioraea sp.]